MVELGMGALKGTSGKTGEVGVQALPNASIDMILLTVRFRMMTTMGVATEVLARWVVIGDVTRFERLRI